MFPFSEIMHDPADVNILECWGAEEKDKLDLIGYLFALTSYICLWLINIKFILLTDMATNLHCCYIWM